MRSVDEMKSGWDEKDGGWDERRTMYRKKGGQWMGGKEDGG